MSIILAGQKYTTAIANAQHAEADTSTTNVTGTTFADLSSVYTIPADDAAVGTVYRLTCAGFGTQGSTQQQLNIAVALAGSQLANSRSVNSAAFAASAAFRWAAKILLVVSATGSLGTLNYSLEATFAESANPWWNPPPGANSVAFAGATTASGQSIDTTVDNTVSFQAKWGATTGSPTISCHITMFERLGALV